MIDFNGKVVLVTGGATIACRPQRCEHHERLS